MWNKYDPMHEFGVIKIFLFSLHVFLIMKSILTKRSYYRLGRIFRQYHEILDNISLKHKQIQDDYLSFLLKCLNISNNDRYFFKSQCMNLSLYSKKTSEYDYSSTKLSNSLQINMQKRRFVVYYIGRVLS